MQSGTTRIRHLGSYAQIFKTFHIKHDLVREALRKTRIEKGVEITTLADVPSEGTGLGSSSSVTVGLLSTFYLYQSQSQPAGRLAGEACQIEVE